MVSCTRHLFEEILLQSYHAGASTMVRNYKKPPMVRSRDSKGIMLAAHRPAVIKRGCGVKKNKKTKTHTHTGTYSVPSPRHGDNKAQAATSSPDFLLEQLCSPQSYNDIMCG